MMNKLTLMLASCSVFGGITEGSAKAQVADQATSSAEPGSRQSMAGQESSAVGDIVVTAQRRSETVQKSSLAIQVITSEAASQISQARDLNTLVPGMQMSQQGTATQVFIRGVGDRSVTPQANPGVAFNADGVYVARPNAVSTLFFDLERIEVVKGPQGTLYGRNASGGAVNLITKKPSFAGVSGNISVETGNFDLFRTTSAINLPLSEAIAVRAAFDLARRDGYLSDGTDDDKHEAGRLHILLKPIDDLSVLLTADFAHVHGRGPGMAIVQRAPGLDAYSSAGSVEGIAYLGSQLPLGPRLTQGWNFDPYVNNKSKNVSAEVNYDMGWANLTVLPAYRDYKNDDRTFQGYLSEIKFHSKQFSFESRLSHDDENIKWVAGVYYFRENTSASVNIRQGLLQNTTTSYPENDVKSYATFGQITYAPIENLRVILGGRYTIDKRFFAGVRTPVGTAGFPFQGSLDDETFTWKAGLEFDVAPSNMLYLTASTGFKAGGINPEPAPNLYAPEKLTAFEFGSRNRFLDGRLQINLEAFRWTYENNQISVTAFDNVGAVNQLVLNAGKATLYGGNIDVVARVTRSDTIRGFAEYNHAKYDSFVFDVASIGVIPGVSTGCAVGAVRLNPLGLPVRSVDCSGFSLVRAPRWTGAASWDHQFDLPGGAQLTARVSGQFSSSRWGSPDFISSVRLPAYVVGNFDLSFTPANGSWSVMAYIRNLGDKRVGTGTLTQSFQPTVAYATVNAPRTYGIKLNYNF